MEELEIIVVSIFIGVLLISTAFFIIAVTNAFKKVNETCECGKFNECTRKIQSSKEGSLWVTTEGHFNCGKIQEQIMKHGRIRNNKTL